MDEQNSEWISFSDIMTGLMLVFLLISVLTTLSINNNIKKPLLDFVQGRKDLCDDLKSALASKEKELGVKVICPDLIMKFTKLDSLFDQDSVVLKREFKEKLDEFLPMYLSVINKPEYGKLVKEVRIEGHTADYTPLHNTDMALITLSQGRSNSVLEYMWDSEYYNDLGGKDRKKLFFWFSANGFGKGKMIDDDEEHVYKSGKEPSAKSRRVEFKLITDGEELINEILDINKV